MGSRSLAGIDRWCTPTILCSPPSTILTSMSCGCSVLMSATASPTTNARPSANFARRAVACWSRETIRTSARPFASLAALAPRISSTPRTSIPTPAVTASMTRSRRTSRGPTTTRGPTAITRKSQPSRRYTHCSRMAAYRADRCAISPRIRTRARSGGRRPRRTLG